MKNRIIYYISQTKISRDIKYKINNNYFNNNLINFNKKKKKLNSLEKKKCNNNNIYLRVNKL